MGRFTKEMGRGFTTPQPRIPGLNPGLNHFLPENENPLVEKFKEICKENDIVPESTILATLSKEQYVALSNGRPVDVIHRLVLGRPVYRMVVDGSEIRLDYLIVGEYSCKRIEYVVLQ